MRAEILTELQVVVAMSVVLVRPVTGALRRVAAAVQPVDGKVVQAEGVPHLGNGELARAAVVSVATHHHFSHMIRVRARAAMAAASRSDCRINAVPR